MFYDTIYRHDQALSPDGLKTLSAALHAVLAAVDDCRRAGKPAAYDAAVLLLLAHFAGIAAGRTPLAAELRARCRADRAAVLGAPALLAIAGHSVGGDQAAKRTFHCQARRALARVAEAAVLDPASLRIDTLHGDPHEDGATEMRHDDLLIRVVPRGFLPDSEVSITRCVRGEPAGRTQRGTVRELLDAHAFARRLTATLADGEIAIVAIAA